MAVRGAASLMDPPEIYGSGRLPVHPVSSEPSNKCKFYTEQYLEHNGQQDELENDTNVTKCKGKI